jgi:RHS repeat-associated protein
MKFTGHERDTAGLTPGFELDYMHARYYDPNMNRFLSPDPGKDWDMRKPNSWNLYTYVRNNPIAYVDPDGQTVDLTQIRDDADRERLIAQLRERTGLNLDDKDGVLKSRGALKDANGRPLGSAAARAEITAAIGSNTVFKARSANSTEVDIAASVGDTILMDFTDIGAINVGKNAPGTVNAASIFLHELRHSDGGENLEDPTKLQLRVQPTINGPNVVEDNRINQELGLPRRNQYQDRIDKNGSRYWDFENGPVYLPAVKK